MELALQIAQFILSISILVVLHELGHFLPAKWFKTKVEKFYLFFDPYFSLIKKKIGETEYGIGWLPFGGYVKIAGMVDESMDKDQLKSEPQPWEFRSKPAWQRLIIMLGGVTVNFFLAWLIFSALSFNNGETYTDLRKFENGISVTEAGKKLGFQNGDQLLKVDGKEVTRLENASLDILFSDEATVMRNGKEITFPINEDGVAEIIKQRETKLYLLPRNKGIIIDSIVSATAKNSGLTKNDEVLAVNGQPVHYYDEFSSLVHANSGKTISLDVKRDGKTVNITEVLVDENGKIGLTMKSHLKDISHYRTHENYSFFQAIPRGLERTFASLTTQVKQFKIIFNSKTQGYKQVGGPIAIVKMMPVEKGEKGEMSINWTAFWTFTAMFSVWLAFLNLLPIPGLDGGHVVFTLWEMLRGKPAPQKVLENAQMIGMIFLLGLMLLIFGNDIFKVLTNKL